MPDVFANGGGPDYPGISVLNGFDILDTIRVQLTAAGWTELSNTLTSGDDFAQEVVMQANSIAGGHSAFYKFHLFDNSASVVSGAILRITGYLTAGLVTASGAKTTEYLIGAESRIWISANQEAGALCLRSFGGLGNAFHFGFLDRVEPLTDEFAHGLGRFFVGLYYDNDFQIAKAAHDAANWDTVRNRFMTGSNSNFSNSASWGAPVQGVWDRHTVCINPYTGFDSSQSNQNVGRFAYNGQLNGLDGKAILGELFYVEGRASFTDYLPSGSLSPQLYYRGNVHFAVTGLSSLNAFVQVEDAAGTRYISGGGTGWQGFQIAP